MKSPRLTRRSLAAYLAAPALIGVKTRAQTPAQAPVAAPAPVSNRVQEVSRALAAVKLPRNIEPATRFEA